MAIKTDRPPQQAPDVPSTASNDPPSYSASTSTPPTPAQTMHDPEANERTTLLHTQQADKRARKRVIGAWLCGVGIWLIVGLLMGKVVVDERGARGGNGSGGNGGGGGNGKGGYRKSFPGTLSCNAFHSISTPSSYPFLSSQTSLVLPLAPSFDFFFNSEGPYSHGSATFLSDVPKGKGGWVDVVAKYDDETLLSRAQVCVVKDGKSIGLEVWTPPDYQPSHSMLSFTFTFHLPSFELNSFTSNTSIISHSIPAGLPQFSKMFFIHTSNSRITIAPPLNVDIIDLSTSNAAIEFVGDGVIEGRESLKAQDKNGKISSAENILLDSPRLSLLTSNAGISSTIKSSANVTAVTDNASVDLEVLLAGSEEYHVKAQTSNGGLKVAFGEQSLGSKLVGEFTSKNSAVDVELHKEYQGSFEIVHGSLFSPTILPPTSNTSPSHKGPRSFSLTGKSQGSISWADGKEKMLGDVKLQTSNAKARLSFE